MNPQSAADLIAQFATDTTYERYPSLKAYMSARVKNELGDLSPEEKLAIWALVKPEHQKVFKDSLALHRRIDERMHPQEKLPDKPTPSPEKPSTPL
jgi:hypothetical protein